MNISKTKKNFIGLTTLFTIVCGVLGAVVLHQVFPGSYFSGYPFIPIYFFLYGVFSIFIFDKCRQYAHNRLLLSYLAIKMVKMILSIIIVLIYCVAVRMNITAFMLTFISFYLVYLIYETWFFFTFEMNRKMNNKKENETVA